ncbi:hypothetical protein HOG98_02750 [bacterium]|jgi:hypothetical protein|nr:hypothetical protein [bacterium]
MEKKCNKCKFSQGLVLGAVGGLLLGLFITNVQSAEATTSIKPSKKDEKTEPVEKEKTEDLINKTLNAIDQGFEKINTMISDIKQSDTK